MSTLTPEQLRAEANARVRNALARIERAQNELASACADLSSLVGGIQVWNVCHKLTDKVRDFWYRVDRFRAGGKFSLDSINVEAIERRMSATSVQP
jgi:hypothetical protein